MITMVLINLWIYIKPGLFEYEAKAFTWVILILLISISIGFLLGYSKIIPLAWQFFIGFELNIDNLPYSILL